MLMDGMPSTGNREGGQEWGPQLSLSPADDVLMPGPCKALILPNGIKIFAPALYLHKGRRERGLSPVH